MILPASSIPIASQGQLTAPAIKYASNRDCYRLQLVDGYIANVKNCKTRVWVILIFFHVI